MINIWNADMPALENVSTGFMNSEGELKTVQFNTQLTKNFLFDLK